MTNSDNSGIINHEGIVQGYEHDTIIVSIISASACSECHAENFCTFSGKEEKIIEIHGQV